MDCAWVEHCAHRLPLPLPVEQDDVRGGVDADADAAAAREMDGAGSSPVERGGEE